MLKKCASLLHAILVVSAVGAFASSRVALADTYALYNLGYDQGWNLTGLMANGDVVIHDGYCEDNPGIPCYSTYSNGVAISTSETAPIVAYDEGTKCAVPIGNTGTSAECNNGRTAFEGYAPGTGYYTGIHIGPVGDLSQFEGYTQGGFLNADGDYAWDDTQQDYFYELVDTSETSPVPEPSGLLLIGTGAIALLGLVHGKRLV